MGKPSVSLTHAVLKIQAYSKLLLTSQDAEEYDDYFSLMVKEMVEIHVNKIVFTEEGTTELALAVDMNTKDKTNAGEASTDKE